MSPDVEPRGFLRRAFLLASVLLMTGCAAARPQARMAPPEAGDKEFQSYCAACHQYDGQGVGQAPPLEGSSWVTGPETRLIKIVLHGVRGSMAVAGKTYNREMPGFGKVLSDAEIAALLSFIRKRFGGIGTPVETRSVARIRVANADRSDYWAVEELLQDR